MDHGKFLSLVKLLDNFKEIELYKGVKLGTEEDIKKIPIMTRDRLHNFRLSDCPEKPIFVHSTSGSTGKNLFVFFSKKAFEATLKRKTHLFNYFGIKKGALALNLFPYGLSVIGDGVQDVLVNEGVVVFPVGVPKSENFYVMVDAIRRLKPEVIFSPVSLLYETFEELNDSTIVKKIIAGGSLFSPVFYNNIKKMSGAEEIYDCYGCNEAGAFAVKSSEIPGCFRVFDDGLILEVEHEGKISEQGKGNLLITDLSNYSMPFIRYHVGDKVELLRKGPEVYMKFLGRTDSYTNFNNQVVPLPLLVKLGADCVGHDKFFYLIDKDEKTNRDHCMMHVQKKDLENAKGIKEKLNQNNVNISIQVKEWHKFPMTDSGKYINIIDKRKRLLPEKGLNI